MPSPTMSKISMPRLDVGGRHVDRGRGAEGEGEGELVHLFFLLTSGQGAP